MDGGCPWTAEQRALDVLGYLSSEIEEIREELDLGSASPHHALLSELGDLLFCTFLLIRVCERDKLGGVSLAAAAAFASAKVRRRAPFVFSDDGAGGLRGPFPNTLLTGEEASAIWKRVKALEKAGLVPVCPAGYDYIDGTCILPDPDADCNEHGASAGEQGLLTTAAARPTSPDPATGPVAAGAAPPPQAGQGDSSAALPLLAAFTAGVAAGALCFN